MKTPQESEPFQTVIRIRNFVISGVTSPNNICAQKCAERMTRAMLYGYPRWRTICPWWVVLGVRLPKMSWATAHTVSTVVRPMVPAGAV